VGEVPFPGERHWLSSYFLFCRGQQSLGVFMRGLGLMTM